MPDTNIALFDLDNTLLAGDSDHLWGEFLIEQGVVDHALYQQANDRFYHEYKQGTLDIHEFLAFSLTPLRENDMASLLTWRRAFMEQKIRPIMLEKSFELLEKHRALDHKLVIITATNQFVTAPIAEAFKVDALIATEPAMKDGRYTGKIIEPPCFQGGKVTRLKNWLAEQRLNMSSSWFYSDSHNDLPLLELSSHAIAVDPDETLKQHAEMKGWPVMSLR